MKQTELFNKLRTTQYKTVGKDLQYLIEIDESEKKIRVMFQESHSTIDWILNFLFPIIPIMVHGTMYNFAIGWYSSWYSGRDFVIAELFDMMKLHLDFSVEICGYSFGGAIAQLCGIQLYEETGLKADLITFGSPKPLFGLCKLWSMRCFNKVTQYANKSDIVTYCPPLPFYFHVKNKRIGKFSIKDLFNPEKSHQAYDQESLYE